MSVLGGSVKDRRRKEHLTQIKEETGYLVHMVRSSITAVEEGLEGIDAELSILRSAFYAWATGVYASTVFGAITFHFSALNVLLKTIRNLERAAG